ncbi:MAG: hypothetical protein KKI08_16935 [Armatimonadetes bacterium]|nr:hypothetical protein [Armatimonadota bacterium]
MIRTARTRAHVVRTVAVAVALGLFMLTGAVAQPQILRPPQLKLPLRPLKLPGFLLPQAPDLQVSITGPGTAVQGQDIGLSITVSNKGTAPAPGTKQSPADQSYMVDIVLSRDSVIPVEWATQPVYQGLTRDDFVEDMLMLGGRISNTDTLAPGKQVTYKLTTHIPLRTEPGVYCLAAVVDAGENVAELREANNVAYFTIRIGAANDPHTNTPPGVGTWVLPYAVGNTLVTRIKPTGFMDYVDTMSGLAMNDAPFGSRLGLRHGYDAALPNGQIAYYRWTYRRQGATVWEEFTEPVGVHYQKTVGSVVSFPVLSLGPRSIGSMNLYAFKPHTPPTIPGATTAWPASDWFGDIYSGFLDTRRLADGRYDIKLEVFGPAGNKVMPGPTTFRFLVPTTIGPDGTINTALAPATPDGGYMFPLQVDNRACVAYVNPPAIGTTTASDECGFLLYDPAVAINSDAAKVHVSFAATQPAERGRFRFTIYRGIRTASTASAEIGATSAGVYSGDGNGHFQHKFVRTELLGPICKEKAAFSANLYVYAKATTGWHHRLSGLDASFVRAFAIAPQ